MRIGSVLCNRHFVVGPVFTIMLLVAQSRLPAQETELGRTRKIAEAQHDIVVILIKKKEFDKAAEEAKKIFDMKWPEDEAPVLKDELLRLSDLFRHYGQPEIALRLLDTYMCMFKSAKIQTEVLKDKAYLLEGMGRHDQALECYREYKRLVETKDLLSPCNEARKK
jgi:tetratricopeptide (TPR) repeat protein